MVNRRQTESKQTHLKKIYCDGSSYKSRFSWDRYLLYRREMSGQDILPLLEAPDTFMSRGRMLKDGNTCTLVLVNLGGLELVIKRYNIKNAWHALKRCPRPSRAWKSWKNAHRLTLLDIPTPRPIALVENRWGPLRSKASFITEFIQADNLNQLVHAGKLNDNGLENVAEQFAAIFRLFDTALLSHGDFKATNFLIDAGKLVITDLDAMCKHRFRWTHRRAFKKDYQRLMKNWRGMPEIEKAFQKRFQHLIL